MKLKKDDNGKVIVKTPPVDPGIEEIANSLLDSASAISEHVIANEEQKAAEMPQETGFDPAIHAHTPDGKPIYTKTGAFRNKSGRKSGTTSTISKNPSQLGSLPIGETPKNAGSIMAGIAAANLLFQAGTLIGGEEWTPIINAEYGINEKTAMEKAFGDYFESQAITDFPPGVALAVTIVAYAAPRFMMPKTKTRMEKVFDWFKNKFGKKVPEKVEEKKEA